MGKVDELFGKWQNQQIDKEIESIYFENRDKDKNLLP